jgi:hypothetical protein
MLNLIPEGKYLARPTDWGLSKTKTGDPQAFVTFEFGEHKLTWFGSLKEGRAQEITIDALLTCGMSSNNIEDLAKNDSGLLDTTKDVQIVVVHEEWNEKVQVKIKWVNPVGGGIKKADASEFKNLKSLKGAVLARRKETGIDVPDRDEDLTF